MKYFVVIGLGTFGQNTAIELEKLGHQVLVIDQDEKRVNAIKELVTESIIADATDKKVLSEFVNKDVDAVILNMGDNLEANALTTLNLISIGVKRIIIKAKNDAFGKILTAIGATDIIYSEREGAKRLAQKLHSPNLIEHIPLSPEYEIVELAAPDKFIGKTLDDLKIRNKYKVVVIAVKDILSNEFHLIPGADFEFCQ
ncbi:MAG: TrkA family potassium uptake protein, partial [Thermodesulfobacteriota bacterium]|nr:TrkA family potassium uptake protein [Thermodesulfobacteriota bacterium]